MRSHIAQWVQAYRRWRIRWSRREPVLTTTRARVAGALVGVIVIAAAIAGAAIDGRGLLTNLFADLIILMVGIAVAVTLSEGLRRRMRARENLWVQRYTERAIAEVIEEIALLFHVHFGLDPELEEMLTTAFDEKSRPHKGSAKALRELANRVELFAPWNQIEYPATKLYEETRPLFDRLWYQLLPRVIALGGDVELAMNLLHVEERECVWRRTLLYVKHGNMPEKEAWPYAAETLRMAVQAYWDLVPRFEWDPGRSVVIRRDEK